MKTTDQKLQPLKNGDISSYSLLCGYIQKSETETRWKHIYMEHGCFHVRTGQANDDYHHCYDIWETFDRNELTKARKFYHSLK